MNAPEPDRDLMGALERIEEEARRARHAFGAGELVNGRTPLRRIEEQAEDALARATEQGAHTETSTSGRNGGDAPGARDAVASGSAAVGVHGRPAERTPRGRP